MFMRIKEIRKYLNMNQTDFAKHLGLSQPTLAMIEMGKRSFNDKHIRLVCSAFNINEDWLRTGDGQMFDHSLYEQEFMDIFETLESSTQKYLLAIAQELFNTQNRVSR